MAHQPGALVVAHRLEEPGSRATSCARAHLVERDAAAHQPARDLGQRGRRPAAACAGRRCAVATVSGTRAPKRASPASVSADRADRARSSTSSRGGVGAERHLVQRCGPALMNTTRSQVTSTSPSRCELRNTVVPARAQLADDVAHQRPAERIEPRRGLVEEHQLAARSPAPGRARSRCSMPLLYSRSLRSRGVEQVDAREQRLGARVERALAGMPEQPAVEAQQLAAGEPVLEAEVLGQEARRVARARAVADRRAEQRRARPRSAVTSPSSILSEVVLPAPLGPRKPKTSPRRTDRERSATASFAPKRLRSPWVSMASPLMRASLPYRLGHLHQVAGYRSVPRSANTRSPSVHSSTRPARAARPPRLAGSW